MPEPTAERAPETISGRQRNYGTMPSLALPITEVLVVADGWRTEPDAEAVIHRAIAAAAEMADADTGEAELAVMLTDDAGIRTLNNNWRGIDKPTNVLAFPAADAVAADGPGAPPRQLGDVVVAYETVAREAAAQGKTLAGHLSHLIVHGVLHLLGFDHATAAEAADMEAAEIAILAGLGVADPYRAAA